MVRRGRIRVAVAMPDEPALNAPAKSQIASVAADDETLQAEELFFINRGPPRLANRLTPALNPIVRGTLAFDDVGRLAVVLQQEGRGACHQVRRGAPNDGPGFFGEVAREHCGQIEGQTNQRAEKRRAREIVANSVARVDFSGDRELALRVDGIRGSNPGGGRQVEALTGQPFEHEPGAPRMPTRRLAPNPGVIAGRASDRRNKAASSPRSTASWRSAEARWATNVSVGLYRGVTIDQRPSVRSVALTGREKEVRGWDIQAARCGECRISERPDAAGHGLSHHGGNPLRQVKVLPYSPGWFFGLRNLVHRG
jgi:hypothetical protein